MEENKKKNFPTVWNRKETLEETSGSNGVKNGKANLWTRAPEALGAKRNKGLHGQKHFARLAKNRNKKVLQGDGEDFIYSIWMAKINTLIQPKISRSRHVAQSMPSNSVPPRIPNQPINS